MTIIELNIAGLHLTRSAPDYQGSRRSWRRNSREWRRNVKSGRHAADPAA